MSNSRPKIIQIVDSHDYIKNNCFQHQLQSVLRENSDLSVVELNSVESVRDMDGIVLSCLKLRTLYRSADILSRVLSDRQTFIYEQDPWESFFDGAGFPGAYHMINEKVKPVSFLNTSKWWSDHINDNNIPSKFVKMWVLPEYCSYGSDSYSRVINVGFMGSLHSYRAVGLEEMKKRGIDVEIVKFTGVYKDYLRALGGMRMFVHDEPPRWKMDGKIISCNSLWGKDVEVISQGAFCLRNREEESVAYGLRNNPLLIEFDGYDELAHLVNENLKLSDEEINDKIKKGVDMIREDIGWKSVIEAIS
jgi:hypothetical protein